MTITVGQTTDQSEWHLPTFDPRNENKYHYKLHSLDIYFWTQQDALQFVNGIRRLLPPAQVEVLDEPGPPPQAAEMSSVVKKLEQAAISDPAYSTPPQGAATFAPPPTTAVHGSEAGSSTFVPMAYNPAAPAAPETVRYREKTPPPLDDGVNPLQAAVAYDYQQQPFSPGFAPVASPGFAPPGVGSPGFPPPQFGAPPTHPSISRSATMPAHLGMASPGLTSPYGAGYPGSPGFAPPPTAPAHQASAHPKPTPPATTPGAPPPPGGYSQYSYSNPAQAQAQAPGSAYAIHQQVYRPTDFEHGVHPDYKPKTEVRGKVEENAGRLERGVTGMLKKFEKKFG